MSDLRDLYQEVILDHGRRPRNFRRSEAAARKVEGVNPLCGDRLTVYLELEGDRVKDLCFEGAGCAISQASASLMTESLAGRTVAEAERVFHDFHTMITGDEAEAEASAERLGKLAVFEGVRAYPMRVKCATLPWHTAHAALSESTATVSTE